MTNSISQVCLTTFLFQRSYFKDAIPVPENLEDLLAELEAAQKAEKDNEKRADALTPRSQEAYADAGDTKRATRDVPDEMGALEDELKGGFSVSVWNKISNVVVI